MNTTPLKIEIGHAHRALRSPTKAFYPLLTLPDEEPVC